MSKKTVTLALTGSFGTGKSTAAKIFKELGAYVLDCDQIAKELTRKNSLKILKAIRRHFGSRVFDSKGNLKRRALGSIVFANRSKRKALEKILHPAILKELRKRLVSSKNPVRVVEIPLLFEVSGIYKKWLRRFDASIVVFADENTILQRLKDKGMSSGQFYERTRNQMPIELKCKQADFVVDNNKSRRWLKKQIRVIQQTCSLAGRSH